MSCGEPAEATPRAGCPRGRGTGRATLGGQAGPLRAVQGPRVFSGYGKMSVHHTRPMASRTFEGEGSGQPGDAFWEELIMSQHLCPSTKMYKYLQHTRRLL